MNNHEISRQLQSLRDVVKKTSQACGGDIEMQAHWARYLCVLTAGLIENALVEVYQEFVKKAASKPVADYASSVLSKLQNPKTTKFIEVARAFDPAWGDDLENYVNENGRREAIDSIMANRHLIAHGKYAGITVARVTDYLNKAMQVIEFIEQQCEK